MLSLFWVALLQVVAILLLLFEVFSYVCKFFCGLSRVQTTHRQSFEGCIILRGNLQQSFTGLSNLWQPTVHFFIVIPGCYNLPYNLIHVCNSICRLSLSLYLHTYFHFNYRFRMITWMEKIFTTTLITTPSISHRVRHLCSIYIHKFHSNLLPPFGNFHKLWGMGYLTCLCIF